MTDYEELAKALRGLANGIWKNSEYTWFGGEEKVFADAAAAIEALQAEVQFYEALADEWKSSAENKERLLGLYRAEQAKHFYSATDDNGRIIKNPCACLNIPVFPDSSEIPNS